MKSKIIKLFAASLFFGSVASCNYLDVSDEYVGGLSDFEQIFDNVDRTKRWYGEVFTNVPDYSRMWGPAGIGNIWSFYADEMYSRIANNTGKYNEWNARNTESGRWSLYESIRQANIFLEMAHPIEGEVGNSASILTESTLRGYKAEVRFMRALYYYYLVELYGPVPLVTESKVYGDDLDTPRASLDKLIEFIDTEMVEAMAEMTYQEPNHSTQGESYRAVPTKGVALAARAKLWVMAASKLYNGGFPEALQVKNKDGERLFPDYDATKWAKAMSACRDLIEYAESGARYDLYRAANGDPNLSIYEVFQNYNTEIIWATAKTNWGALGDQNFDSMVTPRSEPKGLGGMHILQELVDDFFMADGYPAKTTAFLPQSPTYSETGFGTYDGIEVSNMYIGREPRFYNTVTFSGKKWHISNKEVQLYLGGNADNTVLDGAPLTGYFLYKRMNRTVYGNSPGVNSKFRPSIIFRLADFYLLYAESLNEVEPSNPDVLKYVNLVRDRAGLPSLESLNPSIAGNQELQREAIRHERRIELATEGQRYFDVRRWMIAENPVGEGGQGGDFTSMDPYKVKADFHTRKYFQTRSFKRKNYFYPISLNEMQKSKVLVQNPLW